VDGVDRTIRERTSAELEKLRQSFIEGVRHVHHQGEIRRRCNWGRSRTWRRDRPAFRRRLHGRDRRAHPVAANTADQSAIAAAFETIRRDLGDPRVLIYNAAMRPFGRLMETKPSTFENTWRVNTFGAFLCAQQVVPAMLAAGRGVILFTGATAGVKPYPTSAAFGPAKFAMRGLAQVMARDLQPQGIHVAYVNVDGAIDMPLIRQRFPEIKDEDMLKPAAIADAYWFVAHQDRSAWTHELDVRPFKEKF
jgi:NAD(P)-dependent dehydrogenase (short-subunit alcohol dehydrogenase family)